MKRIVQRIEAAESAVAARTATGPVRRFLCSGPIGFDAEGFLRSCGHEIAPGDIIRVVVGAEDGKAVDLPLADLTHGSGR